MKKSWGIYTSNGEYNVAQLQETFIRLPVIRNQTIVLMTLFKLAGEISSSIVALWQITLLPDDGTTTVMQARSAHKYQPR